MLKVLFLKDAPTSKFSDEYPLPFIIVTTLKSDNDHQYGEKFLFSSFL